MCCRLLLFQGAGRRKRWRPLLLPSPSGRYSGDGTVPPANVAARSAGPGTLCVFVDFARRIDGTLAMPRTPVTSAGRTSARPLRSTGPAVDLGLFLLRAGLGLLILLHGVAKIASGPQAIVGLATRAGLPPAFAYLVYVGEVVAPLLLVVGLWTRPAALVVAINMVVAIALAHAGQLFELGKSGGWALELQGMFLLAALAIALLGAGRYSVGGSGGRWN